MFKKICLCPFTIGMKLSNGLSSLANYFSHLFALGLRFALFHSFIKSGLAKYSDMESTLYLFQNEYVVSWFPLPPGIVEKYNLMLPQMNPIFAAYSGTFVEIIFPVLLLLGIGGRIPAFILFVFNYIAVVSYPLLWQPGWEGAFKDHIIWGVMSATLIFYGSGKISLDALLKKTVCKKCNY